VNLLQKPPNATGCWVSQDRRKVMGLTNPHALQADKNRLLKNLLCITGGNTGNDQGNSQEQDGQGKGFPYDFKLHVYSIAEKMAEKQ
jgi:hypothetical protein